MDKISSKGEVNDVTSQSFYKNQNQLYPKTLSSIYIGKSLYKILKSLRFTEIILNLALV